MKAVLVIDMPEKCEKCPMFYRISGDFGCNAGSCHLLDWGERPSWCPLIPDYRLYVEVYDVEQYNQEIEDWLTEGSCSSIGEVFTQIWNECVDRILGEVES